MPSGNTATMSPSFRARAIVWTTRSASRLRSRSRYSVPAASTNRDSNGQAFTSAFETKRACGHTACTAMMSSHEMWFTTSKVPPVAGTPSTCNAMPITRSIFTDHH